MLLFIWILSLLPVSPPIEKMEYKAVYGYRFQLYKSNPDIIKRGNVYLYLSDMGSVFLDEVLLQQRINSLNPRNDLSLNFASASFKYTIFKNYSNHTLQLKTLHKDEIIGYEEPTLHEGLWSIHDDTATVGGYGSQKATIQFGGRNWTAWFASEIPISDGPYKFGGLPGLITAIESEDKEYKFELRGFERLKSADIIPTIRDGKIISRRRYEELTSVSGRDKLDELARKGVANLTFNANGRTVSREEVIEQLDREEKDKNWIEKH
jgi:GLPGLI family protein